MSDLTQQLDVLVMAKTVATTRFPIEPAGVGGVDRESGRWIRLSPFPFGERDSQPPLARWSWVRVSARRGEGDPRPETHAIAGDVREIGYVEAKDGWRLRWPFVRPHLRPSVEALVDLARAGTATVGFIRPAAGASLALDSLTLRFRCDAPECGEQHAFPVLDWEIRETTRALHERDRLGWRGKAEAMWGQAFFERYDVHVLLSNFAQAPTRLFVAGLFYPPRERETPEEHAAHAQTRDR